MYDLMIVGSGPAGVSAALSARARGLDFIWFGSRRLSEKLEKAEKILNYPGLSSVTGVQFRDALLSQIEALEIVICEERVVSLYQMEGTYAACTEKGFYESRCVLLATGVVGGSEIPGESRFMGRGVSCCATCDGDLYKDKRIAVICTAPSLCDEIFFLARLARSVELFTSFPWETAHCSNVIYHQGKPQRIEGSVRADAVICGEKRIEVDGVFCLRESISPTTLLPGIEMENGHVRVDRGQQTSLQGCFAAGDCTGRPYQYAKAVGEGNVALHSVLAYLKEWTEKTEK